MSQDNFAKLAAILSRAFEAPLEQITPESRIAELGQTLDHTDAALSFLVVLVEINEHFAIDLPLADYETAADMLNPIEELLQAKQRQARLTFRKRAELRRKTKRLSADCQPLALGEPN